MLSMMQNNDSIEYKLEWSIQSQQQSKNIQITTVGSFKSI